MSLHIECGLVRAVGTDIQPVEVGGGLLWSETLASAGTSTAVVPAAPTDGVSAMVLTLTAEVDMWVSIGGSPNAAANPRRRLKAGSVRSFLAVTGHRVAWAAG
jgi:hypothetical protein